MHRLARLAAAPIVAITLSFAPVASVAACSCAVPAGPGELIATAEVAFIGTVQAVAEAPAGDFGQMFAYGFEVERANRPVAELVEVRAIGGDGGASCGMEFGMGQRWFVAAYSGPDGLETGLCSGNVLLDPADPDAGAELAALLDAVPAPRAAEAEDAGLDLPVEVVAILAAAALLLVGGIIAFRHDGSR